MLQDEDPKEMQRNCPLPFHKEDNDRTSPVAGSYNEQSIAFLPRFGPPPRPLDLPQFSINGTSITLGEEGPEYKQIAAAMMAKG